MSDALERTLAFPADNEEAPAKVREASARWRNTRRAFAAWRAGRDDEAEVQMQQTRKESVLLHAFREYSVNPGRPGVTELAREYDAVRDYYLKTMSQK